MPSFGKIVASDIHPLPGMKKSNDIDFINLDVRDVKLAEIIHGERIEIVIHLAFTVNPVHNRSLAYDIDVNGTKNVIKSCFSSVDVKQIIHTSSTLAYGAFQDNPVLTEDHPLRARPNFPYSYHKRIVEEEIDRYAKSHAEKISDDLVITKLRPCGFIGPNVENYVSRVLSGGYKPLLRGWESTEIQWAHEVDIVESYIKSIEKRVGGAFNITPNDSVSMEEIADIMGGRKIRIHPTIARSLLWFQWNLRLGEAPPAYLDFVQFPFVANNKKAREILSWVPKYSTKEALEALRDT